ncbi:MAG: TIR domain-containing protein [Alphaproteobacteria bacterium]|nr:TIR domain-containing protein [Alphaproteobacteria bacterium]
MSQLFLSHSSFDEAKVLALRDWLADQGWNDVFLDLDPEFGLVGGQRWQDALKNAVRRCEGVIFLISPHWVESKWCLAEFLFAKSLNKPIFGVLVEATPLGDIPIEMTAEWQLVDLSRTGETETFNVRPSNANQSSTVRFNRDELRRLKSGLLNTGLDAGYFEWPPQSDPGRSPYPGLRALQQEDAGIFFGRNGQILEALDRLRGLRDSPAPRMLVVLGASGAGKSSFMRAGLLPRLKRDDRHFFVLPPVRLQGAKSENQSGLVDSLFEGFKQLGKSKSRKAIRDVLATVRPASARANEVEENNSSKIAELFCELLQAVFPSIDAARSNPPSIILPVDQAEEMFFSSSGVMAQELVYVLGELLRVNSPSIIVALTMRSDAYEKLQYDTVLGPVSHEILNLPPMPYGAYSQVIKGPIARMNAGDGDRSPVIEEQLVDELLKDIEAGGAKDALPLLAFILERLYSECGGDGELTVDHYEALGRIGGAIEAAVEGALRKAVDDARIPQNRNQQLALLRRGLIPWLAGVDPDTKESRRKVARLSDIPNKSRPLIEYLVEQRLLATDVRNTDRNQDNDSEVSNVEVTIEPAHEALLRQWGLLEGWLEEDFEALAAIEGVQRAALEWESNNHDEGWLAHSEGRLETAERFVQREDLREHLTPTQRDYLLACRAVENLRRNRELKAQRQITRRTRLGLIAASVLTLISAAIAIWGWTEFSESNRLTEDLRGREKQLDSTNKELAQQAGLAIKERQKAERALKSALEASALQVAATLGTESFNLSANLLRLFEVLPRQNGQEFKTQPDPTDISLVDEAFGHLLRLTSVRQTATRILPSSNSNAHFLTKDALILQESNRLFIYTPSMAKKTVLFEDANESFFCENFHARLFATRSQAGVHIYQFGDDLAVQRVANIDRSDINECAISRAGTVALRTYASDVWLTEGNFDQPLFELPSPNFAKKTHARILFSPSGNKLFVDSTHVQTKVFGLPVKIPNYVQVYDFDQSRITHTSTYIGEWVALYGYDSGYLLDSTGGSESMSFSYWRDGSNERVPLSLNFKDNIESATPASSAPIIAVHHGREIHFLNLEKLSSGPFHSYKLPNDGIGSVGWSLSGRHFLMHHESASAFIVIEPLSNTAFSLVYDFPDSRSRVQMIDHPEADELFISADNLLFGYTATPESKKLAPGDVLEGMVVSPIHEKQQIEGALLNGWFLNAHTVKSVNQQTAQSICKGGLSTNGIEAYTNADARFFDTFYLYQTDELPLHLVLARGGCEDLTLIALDAASGFDVSSDSTISAVFLNRSEDQMLLQIEHLADGSDTDEKVMATLVWYDLNNRRVLASVPIGTHKFSISRLVTDDNFDLIAIYENPYNSSINVISRNIVVWDQKNNKRHDIETPSVSELEDVFVDSASGEVFATDLGGMLYGWKRASKFAVTSSMENIGLRSDIIGRSKSGWLLIKSLFGENKCGLTAVKSDFSRQHIIDRFGCGWYANEKYDGTYVSGNVLVFPEQGFKLDLSILDQPPRDLISAWRLRNYSYGHRQNLRRSIKRRSSETTEDDVFECDRLVSFAFDPQRLFQKGIRYDFIIPDLATKACSEALEESKNHPRLLFQMGRALQASAQAMREQQQDYRATIDQAYRNYEAAWDAGYPVAAYSIANLVLEYDLEDMKRDRAVELYEEAFRMGVSNAAVVLGELYWNGHIVNMDRKRAEAYWRAAAEQGNPNGHKLMGGLHMDSDHANFSLKKALLHYALSVKRFSALGLEESADEVRAIRASLARALNHKEVADIWAQVRDAPEF